MDNKKQKKELRFDYIRDIIIIPDEEYRHSEIWWKERDYIEFQKSAIREVMHLIEIYGQITLHKALILLYSSNIGISLTKNYISSSAD
jgi:hypothetical protein